MCGSMADVQSAATEIRRGKNKIEDRKKPQGKNIMSVSAMQGSHKYTESLSSTIMIRIVMKIHYLVIQTVTCLPIEVILYFFKPREN